MLNIQPLLSLSLSLVFRLSPFLFFLTSSLMPGSIHISVVEWMDTSPQGPISTPYSIKVSVGKKEYQSVGRANFSFPLTSIRDNLIIMLCDFEGNLVTKKEVKSLSVAEKGDTEVVFPLESGGNFKLILSFILSEEEKEKIREMRSSALKRKHNELVKGTNEIFSPGTSSQLPTKDYSKLSTKKNPKMPFESSQNKIEEHPPLHITKEKKKNSFLRVSQSLDDLTGHNNGRSIPNRSPSNNIKKMISAFESNAKQNSRSEVSLRTRTQVNKTNSQISIERESYENEDIEQRRVSQSLNRRSFSAGNLSEAILQNDPNFAQYNETHILDEEVNMENREMNLMQGSGSSSKIFDGCILHGTSHYRDYIVSRDMDQLACIDRTIYFFEISDMLMPYHLCLTSSPKKVWNFLEKFRISSTHNEKIKLQGVASPEVNKEIGIRRHAEDPDRQRLGSSIFNGWLIDQGARIFIVIVACGTIFFNTR